MNKEGVKSPLVLGINNNQFTETDPLLVNESQLLLAGVEPAKDLVVSRSTTVRNLFTAVCLWLGYLFVSAAYSLFGPFFPNEVS